MQITRGLTSTDGAVLGNNIKGQVLIEADMGSQRQSDWKTGLVDFNAESGHIESVSIGARDMEIADICFTE